MDESTGGEQVEHLSPAQHYVKSEQCIAEVMQGLEWQRQGGEGEWDFTVPLGLAQVHATLATVQVKPDIRAQQ
jgi:hypothetical protein